MAIIKMNEVVTNKADSEPISLIPKVDINEPATANTINPISTDPYTETVVLESVPKLDTETYNEYFGRLKVVVDKIQPIPDYKLDLDYDALVILNSYERTGSVDGSLSLKDLLAAIKGTYNNISDIVRKNDSLYQTAITQNAEQISLIALKTTANENEISRVESGIKLSADELKLYVDGRTDTIGGRVDQLSQVVINQEGIILSSVRDEINAFNNYISRSYASLSVLNDRIKSLVGKEDFDSLGNIVTKQQSSITQTADAILLKVSKEEFNALGDVVSQQGTLITQTSESISLKADASFVNTLDQKITTIDGDIVSINESLVKQSAELEVAANAINARVTIETFNAYQNTVASSYLTIEDHNIALGVTNTTISNLTGRVSEAESAITLKADQISLSVTNNNLNALGETVSTQGSKIDQTADKISLLVSADNQILAGVIVNAINGGTVKIAAKNVVIDGNTTFANGYNPADKNRLYVTDYFNDPITGLSKDPLADITDAERELRLGDQWEAIDWELVNGIVTYTGIKRKTFKKEGTSYVWILNETVISAGLITTGKIKADVIDIEELFAQTITATDLHVKAGYVGDFEINSSLTGRNGNNTIVLDPKVPSIVLTDPSEKTVTLRSGTLSSIDSLIGNNYKFYNNSYPAGSYNDIGAILPSTLRSNINNFKSIGYYNKYINPVSGGAYATIVNLTPATYFTLPATVDTKYTVVTPIHLRQKHSLHKGDSGKYHKRRGTIKYEVRVCIRNNADSIVSDGYSIRTDEVFINQEGTATIDLYSVHRQQVTVPAGGGKYYIHVEIKLAGNIQYQVWNNPTFGSSYWSTSDGVNKTLQFDLTLDAGLSINAAQGKTELTTNGFQSVWTENTYFRIDGDNAGVGFIQSKGSWRHNGYEVLVDKSGTLSGQFNPGDYVLGSYLSTNYTTTIKSDAKYAKKAGDSTQDFTVKDLIIHGTVNHWLGDTITVDDANLQLNRQQSGATVASGLVIFNKDTSTEVSKLQYNVNGVWTIDGNRIPTIDINPLNNGIAHWDTATSKFIARASAANSDKLGGIIAANYYHTGNSNKSDVDWTANKITTYNYVALTCNAQLNKGSYIEWNDSNGIRIGYLGKASTVSNDMYFDAMGNNIIISNNVSKVGIGVVPKERFEVNGNTRITGNIVTTGDITAAGAITAAGDVTAPLFIGDLRGVADYAHTLKIRKLANTGAATSTVYYKIFSYTGTGPYQSSTIKLHVTARTEQSRVSDYFVIFGFETNNAAGNIGTAYGNMTYYYDFGIKFYYVKTGNVVDVYLSKNKDWRDISATVITRHGLLEPVWGGVKDYVHTLPEGAVAFENNVISYGNAEFKANLVIGNKVGIGVEIPTQALDVNGTVKASGKGLFGSDLESTAVQFASGFTGQGWKLDVATNHLTIDKLTVRKEFKVYEMIIDQVRAQRGSIAVSPGAAKIDSGDKGRAYVDTDNGRLPISVVVGDKLRCQQNNGRRSKYLVVNVTAVGSDYFDYTVIDGTGWLETGDEVVVFGSNDPNRQGIIYITSSDDGAPYMDVLDGVNSHIHTTPRNIRYIRDWLNGSSLNDGNHWVEIKALNSAGVNIAQGKKIGNSSLTASRITTVTDGNTASSPYHSYNDVKLAYVCVDLESVQEIDKIQVWHFYSDGRTYYNTKTEVSADGVTWYSIFDSAVQGTYAETAAGRSHTLGAGKTRLRVGKLSGISGQSGYGIWGSQNGVDTDFVISSAGYANIAGFNFDKQKLEKQFGSVYARMGNLFNEAEFGFGVGANNNNCIKSYINTDGKFYFIGRKDGVTHFRLDTEGTSHIANWTFNNEQIKSVVKDSGYVELNNNTYPRISVYRNATNKINIYHSTSTDWGIAGFSGSSTPMFQLGSTNQIAGWSFNTGGLRSSNQRLHISNVHNRFVVTKAATDAPNAGPRVQMFYNDDSDWGLYGSSDGTTSNFKLGSINHIAGCNFNAGSIWATDEKWKLNADGSGKLASGKISWTKEGLMTIDSSLMAKTLIGQILKSDNWDSSNGTQGVSFNLLGGVLNISNQILLRPATTNTYADISVLNPESGTQGISISPNPLKTIIAGADGSGTINCPDDVYVLSSGLSGENTLTASLNTAASFNVAGFTTKTGLINGNTYTVSVPPILVMSIDAGNVTVSSPMPYLPGTYLNVTCKMEVINTYNNAVLGAAYSYGHVFNDNNYAESVELPKKVISFTTQSGNSSAISIKFTFYVESGRMVHDETFGRYFEHNSAIKVCFKAGGVISFAGVNGITEISTKGIQFMANNTFFKIEDDTVGGVNDARPFINSNGAFKLTGCDPRNSTVFPIICVAQIHVWSTGVEIIRWSGASSTCPIRAGNAIATGRASFFFNTEVLASMGIVLTGGYDYIIIGSSDGSAYLPRSIYQSATSFNIGMYDDGSAENDKYGFMTIMLTKMK